MIKDENSGPLYVIKNTLYRCILFINSKHIRLSNTYSCCIDESWENSPTGRKGVVRFNQNKELQRLSLSTAAVMYSKR